MDSNNISRQQCAKILWKSRHDAGATIDYMASSLHVSSGTIRNWETGHSSPDIFQVTEWFSALGIQPMPYILSWLYPDSLGTLTTKADDDTITAALHHAINELTNIEKRELLFALCAPHGSPPYSIIQLATAYLHIPLSMRLPIAASILEDYQILYSKGELTCPDNVQPDLSALIESIHRAHDAVCNDNNEYLITR